MFTDGLFNFGIPDINNSNTGTASTNYHDAGSNKIIFGAGKGPKLRFRAVVTADASPSIKVDFVAADNSALSSNPVVLASSGVVNTTADGTTLQSGEYIEQEFEVKGQTVAKRYYGLIVTLGGTNPDTVAASGWAKLVIDGQTNMVGPRAAVPA